MSSASDNRYDGRHNNKPNAAQENQLRSRESTTVEIVEQWRLREYYFRVLQYAQRRGNPLPTLDFMINGRLLCRLSIDTIDQQQKSETLSPQTAYEFTLRYFGEQYRLANAKTYSHDSEIDPDDYPACEFLPQTFEMIVMDRDAPSGICYAAAYAPVAQDIFTQVVATVVEAYHNMSNRTKKDGAFFARLPEDMVERVCYAAIHDAANVSFEIKHGDQTAAPAVSQSDAADTIAASSEQMRQLEKELFNDQTDIDQAYKASNGKIPDSLSGGSAQLQASLWQYNEKNNLMAIARDYEALEQYDADAICERVVHVPFRGVAEDIQKNLYIGEHIVKLLLCMCYARCSKSKN